MRCALWHPLCGDNDCSVDAIERGLTLLESCNGHLTAAAEAVVQTRSALYEREAADPGEPLLARERLFAALDYEAAYRELAASGSAMPRLYWDELVARLREGGRARWPTPARSPPP